MSGSFVERSLTSVLQHPATMRVKGWIRDAWWAVRGPLVRNPPLARSPHTLLFVCKGNICRSPFAARLAARLLERAPAPDVRCLSAGFAASAHGRSPAAACEASKAYGVSLDDHCAQLLTEALMKEADLVVVTEVSHLDLLRRRFPGQGARVVLLPLYAAEGARGRGYRRFNIADPFGKPLPAFEECYTYVDEALRALLEATCR